MSPHLDRLICKLADTKWGTPESAEAYNKVKKIIEDLEDELELWFSYIEDFDIEDLALASKRLFAMKIKSQPEFDNPTDGSTPEGMSFDEVLSTRTNLPFTS